MKKKQRHGGDKNGHKWGKKEHKGRRDEAVSMDVTVPVVSVRRI